MIPALKFKLIAQCHQILSATCPFELFLLRRRLFRFRLHHSSRLAIRTNCQESLNCCQDDNLDLFAFRHSWRKDKRGPSSAPRGRRTCVTHAASRLAGATGRVGLSCHCLLRRSDFAGRATVPVVMRTAERACKSCCLIFDDKRCAGSFVNLFVV